MEEDTHKNIHSWKYHPHLFFIFGEMGLGLKCNNEFWNEHVGWRFAD